MAPRSSNSRASRSAKSAGKRKAEEADGGAATAVTGPRTTRTSTRRREDATVGLCGTSRDSFEAAACNRVPAVPSMRGKLERIDVNTGRARKEPQTPTTQAGSSRTSGCPSSSTGMVTDDAGAFPLPDNAIADVMFSGFLDTAVVVARLSLVSKRVSRIGSEACKTLDLHLKAVTPERLVQLLKRFPHVEYLDLSFCRELHGCEGLGPALQLGARTLQVLFLRGVRVDDETLSFVGKMEQLRRLDVSQSSGDAAEAVTDAGILALGQLTGLTHLSIAWNKNVTDEAVAAAVGQMPRLRALNACLCQLVGGDTTRALAASCADLRQLEVEGCAKMDRASLSALTLPSAGSSGGSGCPKLRKISLAFCSRLTGIAMTTLRDLPGLREVDVRHCELLSEADVQAFREARPDVSIIEQRAHGW